MSRREKEVILVFLTLAIALSGCGTTGRGYIEGKNVFGLEKVLAKQAVHNAAQRKCRPGENFAAETKTREADDDLGKTTRIDFNFRCIPKRRSP